MNKIRLLLTCLLMLFVFMAGCNNGEDNGISGGENREGYSFRATVLEVEEISLLVEPEEGSDELLSADKIIVYLSDAELVDGDNREITVDNINTGGQVEISYTGGIAESYPAQIHGCYKVRLLDY